LLLLLLLFICHSRRSEMSTTTPGVIAAQQREERRHKPHASHGSRGATKAAAAAASLMAAEGAAQALAAAQAQLRTDFEQPPPFADLDAALDAVKSDATVIIAVGASWSLPCRAHFSHLAAACAVVDDPSRVRLFLVDHESFRAFLPEVPIGAPATLVHVCGRPLLFNGRKVLPGMLSASQAEMLLDALRSRAPADPTDVALPF